VQGFTFGTEFATIELRSVETFYAIRRILIDVTEIDEGYDQKEVIIDIKGTTSKQRIRRGLSKR
jgi:hypothetical protein